MSAPDNIPDEVMAWHGWPSYSHSGAWSTTRYPETAVKLLRATPAREHAEELAEALREIDRIYNTEGKDDNWVTARQAITAARAIIAELEKSPHPCTQDTLDWLNSHIAGGSHE